MQSLFVHELRELRELLLLVGIRVNLSPKNEHFKKVI
jgi:hypothetical protein